MGKNLTKALIREHLGDVPIRNGLFGGWLVTMPESKIVVKMTKTRIDFGKFREKANRKNLDEDAFEEDMFACLSLAQKVWGGMSWYGTKEMPTEDLEAFTAYAESYGFDVKENPDCPSAVKKYFGKEAAVKRSWSPPGLRVSVTNGSSVVICGNRIEEVVGSSEVYEAAIRFVKEARGEVVVSGTEQNVLAGIAQGELLGIEIVPEVYPSAAKEKALGMIVGLMGITAGMIYWGIPEGFIWGFVLSLLTCMFGAMTRDICFAKSIKKKARKRGLALRNTFPSAHGGAKRATSYDEAKKAGWL